MSNDYDDDDFSDIPELRKAHRASQKQVKELQNELAELRKQGRERAVKDVLAQRGIPTKIAALIPESVSDEASVTSWLDEFSDVFGITPDAGSGNEQATGTQPQGTPQGMSDADVQGLNAINQAGTGRPIDGEADLFARIQAAQTPQELQAVLNGA